MYDNWPLQQNAIIAHSRMLNCVNTGRLSLKHIKHRNCFFQPDQQLSRLFQVAETERRPVVQLTFVDDDAT